MSQDSPNLHINQEPLAAVAFSGGGFRATLFHLGVLLLLIRRKRIDSSTSIYGVSGGAILAAHFGVYRDQYLSDGESLEGCLNSLLSLICIDLRNRVFRRWLFYYVLLLCTIASVATGVYLNWFGFFNSAWAIIWFTTAVMALSLFIFVWWFKVISPARTRILEAEYLRHLYSKRALFRPRALTLKDLPPNVFLASTSLTTGQLVSFVQNRIAIHRGGGEIESSAQKQDYPLARAVCCSSAFPPGFPPVPLTKGEMGQIQGGIRHAITDGGVHDNLGVQLLQASLPARRGRILVSDAGRPLGYSTDSFENMLFRNMRASDLLMYRVADHDLTSVSEKMKPNYELMACRIYPLDSAQRHPYLDDGLQLQVAQIRTDLDAFSRPERFLLVRHGVDSAAHAMREADNAIEDDKLMPLCGIDGKRDKLVQQFKKQYDAESQSNFRSLLGWLSQTRKFFIGWDWAVLLWLIPVWCICLASVQAFDWFRSEPPGTLNWSAIEPTATDSILSALSKELSSRLQTNRDSNDANMCILQSNLLSQATNNRQPADFWIEVAYRDLKAANQKDVNNCWLFVQHTPVAPGQSVAYLELTPSFEAEAFAFVAKGLAKNDRLILITKRNENDECTKLAQAIKVKQ